MKFKEVAGATPLSEEDKAGLKVSVTTQSELNEVEAAGILQTMLWAVSSRKLKKDLLSVTGLISLHKRMFGEVWKWAGTFRRRDTSIGIDPKQIQPELKNLLDTVKYWMEKETFLMDEIAIRFHHQLVRIHPFPNGNGRFSRLATDLFLEFHGHKKFTWGAGQSINSESPARERYIRALRKADKEFDDVAELLAFARS